MGIEPTALCLGSRVSALRRTGGAESATAPHLMPDRCLERLSAAKARKKVIGRPAIFDMLRYQSASQTVGAITECYNRGKTMAQLPRAFTGRILTAPASAKGHLHLAPGAAGEFAWTYAALVSENDLAASSEVFWNH